MKLTIEDTTQARGIPGINGTVKLAKPAKHWKHCQVVLIDYPSIGLTTAINDCRTPDLFMFRFGQSLQDFNNRID